MIGGEGSGEVRWIGPYIQRLAASVMIFIMPSGNTCSGRIEQSNIMAYISGMVGRSCSRAQHSFTASCTGKGIAQCIMAGRAQFTASYTGKGIAQCIMAGRAQFTASYTGKGIAQCIMAGRAQFRIRSTTPLLLWDVVAEGAL